MHATHRTGTEARQPRETLQKRLFMANVRVFMLEGQLDAALREVAAVRVENDELRQRLARFEELARTCEALGCQL